MPAFVLSGIGNQRLRRDLVPDATDNFRDRAGRCADDNQLGLSNARFEIGRGFSNRPQLLGDFEVLPMPPDPHNADRDTAFSHGQSNRSANETDANNRDGFVSCGQESLEHQ